MGSRIMFRLLGRYAAGRLAKGRQDIPMTISRQDGDSRAEVMGIEIYAFVKLRSVHIMVARILGRFDTRAVSSK